MSKWLRQSTAVAVPIGPFVDDTDGKTPETALAIALADVRLKKNAAAWAQKNEASDSAHEEAGNYLCSLNVTDTATVGHLRLSVVKAGALPVWHDFTVVPAVVYDAMILGTDFFVTPLTTLLARTLTGTGTLGSQVDSAASSAGNAEVGAAGAIVAANSAASEAANATAAAATAAGYAATAAGESASAASSAAALLAKFTGISFLAHWLRAGLRKANNNATAVAEINADTGAGAGTYAPADDSPEAIRDRGDAAWTTGAGGDPVNQRFEITKQTINRR